MHRRVREHFLYYSHCHWTWSIQVPFLTFRTFLSHKHCKVPLEINEKTRAAKTKAATESTAHALTCALQAMNTKPTAEHEKQCSASEQKHMKAMLFGRGEEQQGLGRKQKARHRLLSLLPGAEYWSFKS